MAAIASISTLDGAITLTDSVGVEWSATFDEATDFVNTVPRTSEQKRARLASRFRSVFGAGFINASGVEVFFDESGKVVGVAIS